MKNSEANVFVLIASIIIGILVSTNINMSNGKSMVFLDAKQYKEALDNKNKLLNDIANLKKQYYEYNKKMGDYKYSNKTQDEILQGFNNEIEGNKLMIGLVGVKGEGIKITLDDISSEFDTNEFDESFIERQLKLVHNTDMIQVVNDLHNAGAEAISINGLRLIDMSEIYCNGAFLRINGIKIAAPFYISAIGDKEVLSNYMLSNENYLKGLMLRRINVIVEKEDNIDIPAYLGDIKTNFIKDLK